jgi:hypothetical protein
MLALTKHMKSSGLYEMIQRLYYYCSHFVEFISHEFMAQTQFWYDKLLQQKC